MKPVELSVPAAASLAAAMAWYEERRPGLARELLREVRRSMDLVSAHPAVGRPYRASRGGRLRTLRVDRFPYRFVYLDAPEQVLILQLLHMRRG